MRWLVYLVIAAACEKSGPVETGGGSSSTPREPTTGPALAKPSQVATLPNDAGFAVDAAVVAAPDATSPDAKPARAAAKDPRAAQIEADMLALADQLTAEGPTGSPVDMSRRRPGADLGRQIVDIREGNKNVAVGGAGRGSGGTGDVRVGTGSARTTSAGAESTSPPGPRGRISVTSRRALVDSTLTVDAVHAKIQSAYMAGLKRCYKSYLDKDPTAKGVVTLSLTVQEAGRVTAARAKAFATEVGDCMTAQMSSWRFPVPKDKDAEATQASFEIVLQLVPD